ncbi:MAG: arginine decarboxylase, pyruvoyl-dependent [Candidatus Micrarchaeota archaeon]|nr:arginine decarboxylase, pyruvoyl-dependent [Candidatus Micrarchaeota archaeon]
MENIVPKKIFLTKGVGKDRDPLSSFERALKDAGIERCNLVNVSSILPPNCEVMPRERGIELLKPGQITFVVMSRNSSNEPNRLLASSIGVAIPADRSMYGYLSEYHSFGETDEKAGEKAEDLAASMLASTLGIDFDVKQSWDEKEQLFKLSGKIVKTRNIAQSAIVDKDGMWMTVLSAAVLLLE